jgi:hypothetical protein
MFSRRRFRAGFRWPPAMLPATGRKNRSTHKFRAAGLIQSFAI